MRSLRITIVMLALILSLRAPAHAYIDPGAGSIVAQVIIACVVCALFAIKAFFKNIKKFCLGLFGKKTTAHDDDRT